MLAERVVVFLLVFLQVAHRPEVGFGLESLRGEVTLPVCKSVELDLKFGGFFRQVLVFLSKVSNGFFVELEIFPDRVLPFVVNLVTDFDLFLKQHFLLLHCLQSLSFIGQLLFLGGHLQDL